MLSKREKICVIDEKYVSEKYTKFQVEDLNKIIFKINSNIYDSNGKLLYHCEKNKFCDMTNNVLFEYEFKKGLSTSKLNIFNSKSSINVSIKNKFAFNFDIIFYNETLKKNTTIKMKGHLFKNNYEFYDEDSSLLICSVKKNGFFSLSYTVEMEKGLDTVFMLILIIAIINIIRRNQAAAASG